MPPVVSPVEFLKTIWGESEGYAELTSIGKLGIKSFPWVYPGSVESLVAASVALNKDANVYMGVCLRKEKWPRASSKIGMDGKPIIEYRGTEANASSTWVVWVEFDWKTTGGEGHKGRVVDEALVRKWLAELPIKPSIIIRSGGGIQVYWLLKEAACGEDLRRVKAINKALVEFFTVEVEGKKYGADTQSVDLARILRIPGSMNVKYNPPRPCEISWWKPEFRYTLDDFDFLPIALVETSSLVQPAAPVAAPVPGQALPPGSPRALPSAVLKPKVIEFIREQVQALWLPGQKHHLALKFAGMFAHANVALESAQAIIKAVSDATGSDTEKRLKDVFDTYNRFVSGAAVAGRTSLEDLLDAELSDDAKKKVLSRINAIAKKLINLPPPPAKGGGDGDGPNGMGPEPDFRVTKIVKFNSRPARWAVTVMSPEEKEFTATVETDKFMMFNTFQNAFFEETHCMLNQCSQRRWKLMVGAVDIEVRETPKESRPEGAIETALEEFLSEAREDPDIGILTSFAGYDETSRFFRFPAFKEFMKDQDLKIENRVIFDHMKKMGFKNDVKRFGPKPYRLWIQSLEAGNDPLNGNGHGDGPAEPPKPPEPVQSPSEPFLFMDEEEPSEDKASKETEALETVFNDDTDPSKQEEAGDTDV